MVLWTALLFVMQIALLVPALYLAFLTVLGLFYRPPRQEQAAPGMRLAVLVPAHNEEDALPRLLESLRLGSYPKHLIDIFVVADNCTDRTAEVARAHGVIVHERQDTQRLGKGHALQWLLDRVAPATTGYEGYVFLDADCEVSPNFLEAMAWRLEAGHEAVQAYYTAAHPLESPIAALRFAALALKHYARARGRAVAGLPCGLFGTGMAFSRDVIERFGWSAFGLAEDIEYELQLAKAGIYVTFAPEATVLSAMPTTLRQAKSQNLRWERGRFRIALERGPSLLAESIAQKSWKKLDILLEQAFPPLSVLAALVTLMLPTAVLMGHGLLIVLSGLAVAAMAVHILPGLMMARVPVQIYKAFLFAPIFILWKLLIYVIALLPGATAWVRTQRS